MLYEHEFQQTEGRHLLETRHVEGDGDGLKADSGIHIRVSGFLVLLFVRKPSRNK